MKPGTATLENSVERPRKLLIQSNSFQILPLSPQIRPTLDSRRLLCSCIHYERTMMPHIAKVIRNIPLPLFLNDTLELSRSKLILREFSALYLTYLKMGKLNCYCCEGMFIKIYWTLFATNRIANSFSNYFSHCLKFPLPKLSCRVILMCYHLF